MAGLRTPGIPGIDVFEPFGPRTGIPEPRIPGMEVRHIDLPNTEPSRPAGIRNFPSPEAQAWQAERSANQGPQRPAGFQPPQTPATAPTAQPQPQGRLAGLRNFMTSSGASGGSVGGAFREVGRGVVSGASKVIRGGIPFAAPAAAVTGFNTDTEEYAKRFGLENTEPGLLRDVGVRALGLASDVGNAVTFGQLGPNLFRDKQDAPDAQPRPATLRSNGPAIAPTATSSASPGDIKRMESYAQSNVTAPDANGIQRRGNSFTNTGAFAEDVMGANTANPSERNIAAADALAARYSGAPRGLRAAEPNLPTGYGTTIPGVNAPASQWESELNARNASIRSAFDVEDPRIRAQREENAANRASTERVASMRDATDRRGQDLIQEGYDKQRQVTLRGQDLDFAGRQAQAEATRASSQRQAMQQDRQFQLDLAKFGADQAKTRFDERIKATKEISDRLGAMAPAGADGKPDAQWQARTMEGLNAMVANRQAALERELQRNPNNEAAQKELDAIERQGVGVLTDKQMRQLVVGMRAAQTAQQGDGMFSLGSAVNSTAPITSLRRQEGLLWDDYVSDRGDVIPAWRIDRDGFFFGRPNRDNDILKR